MERKHIKADVGVVVGRFQVDKLHAGHIELLLWVCGEHRKVIVVLGVPAVSGGCDNPLDFESRSQMLSDLARAYSLSLTVVPLDDCRTDKQWSFELDRLVNSLVGPQQTAVLYGARDSFVQCYSGLLRTQELVGNHENWSGSGTRDLVRQAVRPTEDFRAGVIWGSFDHYRRVVTTVDVAIFSNDKVLVARKQGQDKYRFIGGFADPESNSFEADAIREVREETGLKVRRVQYIGSCLIDDWRYPLGKPNGDRIKTMFFRADVFEGCIHGEDESEVFDMFHWANPALLSSEIIVPEHQPLLGMLQDMLKESQCQAC